MTQKELKEMYMNIIKTEVWEDEHMQNFAKKQCAYVVQFSNGDIVDIEKPSIKKDFCFGAVSLIWYDLPPVRCQSGVVSVMRYALHRSPKKADHLQLSCMEIKDGRIIPTSDRQYNILDGSGFLEFFRDLPTITNIYYLEQ